jgi:hypothetical protein
MRAYEKVLLVQIFFCVTVLAVLVADALHPSGEVIREASEPPGARQASPAGATGQARIGEAPASTEEAGNVARRTQDPGAADPSSFLLCAPEERLRRLVDTETRVAVAADEAGHPAFYGGAGGETGTLADDSFELLRGCLPQLAFTNHATVLVEGRGPEAAGPGNVRRETVRTEDGSLLTSFSFAGGVRLDQRLSLRDGALEADYEVTNDARERTSVSLRTLVSPTADVGPSEDGRGPRFLVETAGGERAVAEEREISGEEIEAVAVPRRGAASDSSGRLTFGTGRGPDLVAFAGTLELTAAPFRYAPRSPWPLPPSSSMAAYWLYEDLAPGGSATFSYRYEPARVPAERAE